jgi:hypothetical protein
MKEMMVNGMVVRLYKVPHRMNACIKGMIGGALAVFAMILIYMATR